MERQLTYLAFVRLGIFSVPSYQQSEECQPSFIRLKRSKDISLSLSCNSITKSTLSCAHTYGHKHFHTPCVLNTVVIPFSYPQCFPCPTTITQNWQLYNPSLYDLSFMNMGHAARYISYYNLFKTYLKSSCNHRKYIPRSVP